MSKNQRNRTPKRMRVDRNSADRALAKVVKRMQREEQAARERQLRDKGKS